MTRKLTAGIAFLFMSLTTALADGVPTNAEILALARSAPLEGVQNQVQSAVSDPSAWEISAVKLDPSQKNFESGEATVYAQIRATSDLYALSQEFNGHKLVIPTLTKGAEIGIDGKLQFKRVGFFSRDWQMTIKWNGSLPPGQPIEKIPHAVRLDTKEGQALQKLAEEDVLHKLEELRKKDAERAAETRRQMEEAERQTKELANSQRNRLIGTLNTVVGKWIPYTIIDQSNGLDNTTSQFQGIRIDAIDENGAIAATRLRGSSANAPQAQITGSIDGDALVLQDGDCTASISVGFGENADPHMIFGNISCGDKTLNLSVIPEERTPEEIEQFAASFQSRNAPTAPPQ